MRHKRIDFDRGWIDVLLTITLTMTMLFIMAIQLLNPITKVSEANIKKEADFLIELTWPTDMNCDVDLWVRDPLDNVVFFGSDDKGLTHLERDDLGSNNDKVMTPEGFIVVPENKEIMTIRGAIEGTYIVNTHLYACRFTDNVTRYEIGQLANVPVKIRLITINPTFADSYKAEYVLETVWQEKTAFSFDVTKEKYAVRFSTDQYGMVEDNIRRSTP